MSAIREKLFYEFIGCHCEHLFALGSLIQRFFKRG